MLPCMFSLFHIDNLNVFYCTSASGFWVALFVVDLLTASAVAWFEAWLFVPCALRSSSLMSFLFANLLSDQPQISFLMNVFFFFAAITNLIFKSVCQVNYITHNIKHVYLVLMYRLLMCVCVSASKYHMSRALVHVQCTLCILMFHDALFNNYLPGGPSLCVKWCSL